MLDLFSRKTNECFERELVIEHVGAAQVEHLGADEALHKPEDIRIGSALDLAEQARVGVR